MDDLVEKSGFSRRTIRFYVQEGLLDPPAGRGRGGFYFDSHMGRLAQIRQLQEKGLKLAAIQRILSSRMEAPQDRPAVFMAQPAGGEKWTRYAVAPGIELMVREDVSPGADRINEFARALSAMLEREDQHDE